RFDHGALITDEIKEPVLQNRPAYGPAELIPLQGISRACEIVTRIEVSIAEELEQIAVKRVATRLRNRIDGSRCVQTVLSRKSAAFDFELLQCVRKRHGQIEVVHDIVMHAAVQQVSQTVPLPARDRNQLGGIVADGVQIGAVAGSGHAGEEYELRRLAAIEGEIDDALLVDYGTDSGAVCFHHGGIGLDRDLL